MNICTSQAQKAMRASAVLDRYRVSGNVHAGGVKLFEAIQ